MERWSESEEIPFVWPIKWNLIDSTLTWCHSLESSCRVLPQTRKPSERLWESLSHILFRKLCTFAHTTERSRLIKINVNRFTFNKVCCYSVFKEIKKMTKISISSPLIFTDIQFLQTGLPFLIHLPRIGWRILSKIKAFFLRWYFFDSHKPFSWWCVDVVRRKLMFINVGDLQKWRNHMHTP